MNELFAVIYNGASEKIELSDVEFFTHSLEDALFYKAHNKNCFVITYRKNEQGRYHK